MTKKSRPGIAMVAPRRSRSAGSSVAKSAAKKQKETPQPMKEYSFPIEAWPVLATSVAVLVVALLLFFA